MFVDFHIHESTYSSDSEMTLKQIVDEAKQIGLDGICITDHDSMGLREFANQYSKEVSFPIFVGVEYLTLQGDIVAFGIDELPEPNLSAQEFIDYVNSYGGICISAHPFRNNNRGLEENLLTVKGLTGIEVLNGSTSKEANAKALEYCTRLGLQPIGASDAHNVMQLGRYATYLPKYVDNLKDFIEVLKTQKCKPAILKGYEIQ